MSKGPARKQAAEWVAQSIERVALLAQAFSSAHRSAEALLQLEALDRHTAQTAQNLKQGQAVETGDARSAFKLATQEVSKLLIGSNCTLCFPLQKLVKVMSCD